MTIILEREALGNFDAVTQREWLVTNGLGGYASGTIAGPNTRRYHGLLVAALRPPVERTVMVAKLDAIARYRGQSYALCSNEFADGTISPEGYPQLQSFRLEGQMPIWTWLLGDALLEQRVWMTHGQNTTYVMYKVLRADEAVELTLTPLCTYRDYHALVRGARDFYVSAAERGIKIDAFWRAHPYQILVENGAAEIAKDWYWNFKYRVESERGLDAIEDLFRPAVIRLRLRAGETASIVLTAEASEPMSASDSLATEVARQSELLARASRVTRLDSRIEQLIFAADQFIVERRDVAGTTLGKTVIAGYPWFCDWGRDTMIALPGLTLATNGFEDAASILRIFSKFVSEGMLPNRFPDAGETPEYNTVDATLWYFVAIDEYFRRTQDVQLVKDLYPILTGIVDWHVRGTRYGIHVDSQDGLLYAGELGVQLTWMDAKIGGWVVTPRIGKPVEINALWFNALLIMKAFADLMKDANAVRNYTTLAERVKKSFGERFWCEREQYLYDVIDCPEGDLAADGKRYDARLRPNQLFAISLRHSLVSDQRARAIVERCGAELWTPVGMRSLSPKDRAYAPHYVGDPRERDGAYHQGTVWSWLLGTYASAHFRVHGDASAALSTLDGLREHLRNACIGQVSEIFDGDAPFMPRGCFAQAWGVAEILRVWREIGESKSSMGETADLK